MPLQQDALAEFIADLLLESGLPPSVVDLELLLPLQACQWRVLMPAPDGSIVSPEDLRHRQPELGWPWPLPEAYLAMDSGVDPGQDQLLVGTGRLVLQAWVAVIEAADLCLQRVDWLLAASRRGLLTRLGDPTGDLVWLLQQGRGWRLLVLRDGLPELDRSLPAEAFQESVQELLAAWQQHAGRSATPLRWWITASAEEKEAVALWCSPAAGGVLQTSLLSLALPQEGPGADQPSGLDLLEERRRELGLPAAPVSHRPARDLLIRGGYWGGGLLLVSLLLMALMGWWEGQQTRALETLLPVEARVTWAESRLRRMGATTAALRKDNTRLAEQLVAVRSGSALLEQLRRVTPQGLQLQSLRVQGTVIQLSGEALASGDPGPLERINALVLALQALPMSAANGVKVVKVTRSGDGKDQLAALGFSLTWALDPAVRPSLAELRALGADGMAERYLQLKRAGMAL